MMEQETSEQAISHIRLTFPKRIFEVCHLIKRESEADFFAPDAEGNFTKHIHIARIDTNQVCISLAVDNLTFEANNLCFSVDHVEAKDPEALECILESSAASHSQQQHELTSVDSDQREPVVSAADIDPDSLLKQAYEVDAADKKDVITKPRKKVGRPRKVTTIGPSISPGDSHVAAGMIANG